MSSSSNLNGAKDKPLFTPGPLTTSLSVKQAMLRDLGSRDTEFIQLVQEIRDELLAVAEVRDSGEYECVLLQGSGTFGIEAVLTCAIPRDGKWLILVNGSYGKRMCTIADVHGIEYTSKVRPENEAFTAEEVEQLLNDDPQITAVAIVHCETTTGIFNPIQEIGQLVHRQGKRFFVDSMSAFGATTFDFAACEIDYLVSSANKCIEGVPGLSFCIARKAPLEETAGWSRTLSFDLHAQWKGLEGNGQFRFTPPTHTMLAFRQALRELEQEGGVQGREARYQANYQCLLNGMSRMGFECYLPVDQRGHIITSFLYPEDDNFCFETFYNKLNDRGYVIYPGKVSNADSFRIGNIGRVFEADVRALLNEIQNVLGEMNVAMPAALSAN